MQSGAADSGRQLVHMKYTNDFWTHDALELHVIDESGGDIMRYTGNSQKYLVTRVHAGSWRSHPCMYIRLHAHANLASHS